MIIERNDPVSVVQTTLTTIPSCPDAGLEVRECP